jgi:Cytochrome c554 and c-prime
MQKSLSIAAVVALVVAGIAWIAPTLFIGHAQTKPVVQAAPRPGLYLGAVSCSSGNCHGGKAKNPAEKNFRVRLDEYFIWIRFDRHAKAYSVLLEEKAKNIVKHIAHLNDQKPHEIQLCLNCHALPKDAAAKSLDLTQGVSCESCHGPASGWLSTHLEAKPGTRTQSLRSGMIDVWNPKTRAERCLDCHLGTVDQPEKNVDHELIAAGHPDLRFELDNYSDSMPRHWASYAERANKAGREENEGARAWIIGQTVAFRRGLARLADRARKNNWPEYAELDCYACHHSLQENSWRQSTGRNEGLGLPPWSRARFVMMRHIIAVFAPDKLRAIESDASMLSTAIDRGSVDKGEIAAAATRLGKSMAPVIAQLETKAAKSIDARQVRQFVDVIVNDIDLVKNDIRSAEQAVFAINTLATDIFRTGFHNAAPLKNALHDLAKNVEAPARYTPARFTASMKSVQEVLSRMAK